MCHWALKYRQITAAVAHLTCTAEPLRECGNCRAALNETEPSQEAQIFVLHKHFNTCWINVFNYSPYCSLRVWSLFINLTARVQDRSCEGLSADKWKPKRIRGILFKNYAFTGAVLWIFWVFFVVCFYYKTQLIITLFHLAHWIQARIFPIVLFY